MKECVIEYHYEVGEVVNETLRIVKQIRVKNGNSGTRKGYVVKSLAYPADKNDYETQESHLKRGQGCAYLAGKRVCEESSLYSIENIRPHIIDIEQAKTITCNSGKKMKFKCSSKGCNMVKVMAPYRLLKNGFACQNCSTGIPYPENYTASYLTVKNIPFETQVKFDDLGQRRYDFRIKLNGVTFLLETHGEQHFYTEDTRHFKVEYIQESDSIKRQYAKDNNINLIELDCRESTFEFIRKQIEENEYLPNINDDEVYTMLEIMEQNSKYPVKEIIEMYTIGRKTTTEIAEYYNISHGTIGEILRKQNVDLRDFKTSQGRMVRCIETGVIYQSTSEAARKSGLKK